MKKDTKLIMDEVICTEDNLKKYFKIVTERLDKVLELLEQNKNDFNNTANNNAL